MEKNINIEQGLFFSFSKKSRLKKQKKLINISYLLMVLIKNRLLIFLVFSRYRLACKCGIIFQVHYIIGSRIAFFDAWHTNFESLKAKIKIYFLDKRCFTLFFFFFFEVDFLLKIKDNLCLFALSWREIRHKTRHYQGENSSIFINKMHKEYVIKKKKK